MLSYDHDVYIYRPQARQLAPVERKEELEEEDADDLSDSDGFIYRPPVPLRKARKLELRRIARVDAKERVRLGLPKRTAGRPELPAFDEADALRKKTRNEKDHIRTTIHH